MPQRLVRFLSKTDEVLTGDAILPEGETNIAKAKKAKVITGDIFGKYEVTDQVADIRLLLAPLSLDQVRTVRCLGLNYEQHAKEVRWRASPTTPPTHANRHRSQAGMAIPQYPVLFVSLGSTTR